MRNITLEGKKKSTAFYKKKRKKNKNIKKYKNKNYDNNLKFQINVFK